MRARQVRSNRQVYGRAMPLKRPGRRGPRWPALSLVQRRFVILAIGLVIGVWGLSKAFEITTITVKAPSRGEEIKVETQKLLSESKMQQNLLTFNEDALVSDLQQADPLLRSVEVHRKWFHTVEVHVVMKQPSLGWSTGNQKYLLDRDGTAIGVFPADSKLPIVNDGSNLPVEPGARVAPARFVAFAAGIVPALATEGIGVTSMDIKETTLDLSVGTNKGFRIVLDTGRSIEESIADLRSVRTLLASQKKTPAEYIDLRVAGKAYYK